MVKHLVPDGSVGSGVDLTDMSDNGFIELDEDDEDGDLVIGDSSSDTSEEENSDINESQTQVDAVVIGGRGQGQGQVKSQTAEPSGGDKQRHHGQTIVELMQQADKERLNLVQQIEAEDKNRRWYYDQIEAISRKIRSLPLTDMHSQQQMPGLTRKHLEHEIARLRDTMLDSFGTNGQIVQRREARVHRIREVEEELQQLEQQHREQVEKEQIAARQDGQGQGQQRLQSSDFPVNTSDLDPDQVTMATQTDDSQDPRDSKGSVGQSVPAMYHGSWQIGQDETGPDPRMIGHHDLASVMSFNSTNTSSSQGSNKGQGHRLPQQQITAVPQPIAPQQLGTKVEMVYGLLSMLGTHDKDDMSRTLLAMSSSQDSCTAMRQSGCMPLLIQLLHGSDKDSALLGNTRGSKAARARAAAALHNIVHSHPDDKRGRREARVLRLLEQIRAHCDQLRDTMSEEEEDGGKSIGCPTGGSMDHHPGPAIATLMKLSFDEEHRHAICTLGGLHAIAELLQVDNDVNTDTTEQYNITMRRYACMALTNLTFGDGTNKALLCSMRPSMEALVAQLFSANDELCQVAASVLRNLSWKADLASKKTLREVGAVTSLMEAAMRINKETTLKSILSALWNLSAHCSENKADICAVPGALEFLISTLTYKSPSKTTAIIENGGGILRNVSSHIAVREDYRNVLRQHGCMQILLKHLRSPSLTIVSNACGTLWNLSARCAEDQQALWEMGAVSMLRNLIHSKHKMISMGSSAALKNLLAARPAMKNLELNKQANGNRPSLHVRKQRALESEIDQNLSETCENVESPRDSPVETKKNDIESGHFVYPVYSMQDDHRRPLLRGQMLPRSQSGDNALSSDGQLSLPQRVARSGSQDSVGSTHSDISHDRSRTNSGNKTVRSQQSAMGGSLDRNKEPSLHSNKRLNMEGSERNPLAPNSRILQVMQEVAMHAGLEGQNNVDDDSAVFKVPVSVPQSRAPVQHTQHTQPVMHHANFPGHLTAQQAAMYRRFLMAQNGGSQFTRNDQTSDSQRHADEDEKPLDYSLKYHENSSQNDSKLMPPPPPPPPQIGNFMGKPQLVHNQFRGPVGNTFYDRQMMNNRFQYNSAYAETDLDATDQITDYSARYGAEYGNDHYSERRMNYRNGYEDPDPNCADCKLEEARRYNDRLEQTIENDQIKTFCTEDTPYLSTATSMTDLSTAAKILEEAEQHYPDSERDYNGDEIQNFSSKYGESPSEGKSPVKAQSESTHSQRLETDLSSRSGSQTTDPQTATTVIANYHAMNERKSQDSHSLPGEECQERSFHDNRNENTPLDQTKTYCEEGTPVCFSRVSSLSSLHSSEAGDRQDKPQLGPLQSIEEQDDMNSSVVKMPPPHLASNAMQQKSDSVRDVDNSEKEHKTVTFDDKEQVQETPMMFSRSTSLGSLSSFETQSVQSSVFSEYSRRASEVVSPSELPDSPSESMPPSPKRTKSPQRGESKKQPTESDSSKLPPPEPQQFTNKAGKGAQKVNPLGDYIAMRNAIQVNRQMDLDTLGSVEAPVVYADEGTPPVFSDTRSELSAITMDKYEINDTTKHVEEALENQGSNKTSANQTKSDAKSDAKSSTAEADTNTINQKTEISKTVESNSQNHKSERVQDVKQANNAPSSDLAQQNEDKGNLSVSDVSEGEDDLLANVISSAMPSNSRKMRKSSSDNAIRRKSGASSKTDSGSSSRSKTPAKTPVKGAAEAAGRGSSRSPAAKQSLKMSKLNGSGSVQSQSRDASKHTPDARQRSMIPKPSMHREVNRVSDHKVALNSSIDSTRSYADEDTPFNISNTQSVISKPAQKPSQHHNAVKPSPLIIQKAENLPTYNDDDGCKTYATEDTPFSGSIPASPRNDRKFTGGPLPPDMNQDSVTSFATEDTPFSGSRPESPQYKDADTEPNADTVKCYNTEDTPYTGTAPGSPKAGRSDDSARFANQGLGGPSFNPVGIHRTVPNTSAAKNAIIGKRHPPVPPLDMNEDVVVSYATEDTPLNRSSQPSPKPQQPAVMYNAHMLRNIDYIGSNFEGSDDAVKTFATEGTPLNYSRTGSFSDLSSLNAHFDEKINISSKRTSHQESEQVGDGDMSDNSSLLEESEDLLSEVIQSAMPTAKAGKSKRSMDRTIEGSEKGKDSFRFDNSSQKKPNSQKHKVTPSTGASKNQTSSQAGSLNRKGNSCQTVKNYTNGEDQVKVYAVEGTPYNASVATSLSNLTIDSISDVGQSKGKGSDMHGGSKIPDQGRNRNSKASASVPVTYGTSNNAVYLQSDFVGDSLQVYCVEGTPQTFSCNDSLSSLSIATEEGKGEVAQQIKSIAQTLTKTSANAENNQGKADKVKMRSTNNVKELMKSESKLSVGSTASGLSDRDIDRQVIGQSSEDQSVHEDEQPQRQVDEETKHFKVEDTPICFSRNSSLSSIHDLDGTTQEQRKPQSDKKYEESMKAKNSANDQKSVYKMEHTPICFSRTSSLSSISIHSDEDDDPEEIALLEDCISSALPPRTRHGRDERHRSGTSRSDPSRNKTRSNENIKGSANEGYHRKSSTRNYSSADELEPTGSHDSRYTNWRQQPHRSCDEIFRKPTMDAKGRPCRRSRSQDSEKMLLKQYKDVSNKELAQQYSGINTNAGSYGSLPKGHVQNQHTANATEQQRQQIISESQNLSRAIAQKVQELNRSAEKSDEHENEKNDSPTDEQNFFMTCSGMTEISVESISKQSFPSSMAPPDTDDDILDASLSGSRFVDGEDCDNLFMSMENTLTEQNVAQCLNRSSADSRNASITKKGLQSSITSEDEIALAENANIVMSEMQWNRMGVSGSTVDEDRFIENETLSLVSDYTSDTASEASATWSVSSDRTSEFSDKTNTDCSSPPQRRPRIVKPSDKPASSENECEQKGVRGRRKPLYHSKSVSSASSSSVSLSSKSENQLKSGRAQSVSSQGKISPRTVPGSASGVKKSLRTLPQASSTPVKPAPTSQKQKSSKPSPPHRSSSLDQKTGNSRNNAGAGQRTGNISCGSATKIPSRSSPKGKPDDQTEKPRMPVKQNTFVKESTNKNAPVISSVEKNKSNVKMRQKKNSDSSQASRNSCGSTKSNNSNVSIDGPSESWNKALNSHNFVEDTRTDGTPKKKDIKGKKSGGGIQANARKNLNGSTASNSKIPSPSHANVNKTATNAKKNTGKGGQILKSSSGASLGKSNSGSGLVKTGSNSSLKKIESELRQSDSSSSLKGSRPSTPVNANSTRKGSSSSLTSKNNDANKKQSGGKKVTSKIAGLWRKEDEAKQKNASKLPVAKIKAKPKDNVKDCPRREQSPRPAINRNTVILSESSVIFGGTNVNESAQDGINRSSTYDKICVTNERSQIPSHDQDHETSKKSVFDSTELDRTRRDDVEFEIGVEYSLDDAWVSNVEKSIEVMSRSIEENKNKIENFYAAETDFSKMDLTDSPAKRLSKSGSMSEIELEFGRIHSGTWKKKKSHNDFSMLPNADETSRTLPLVKRSESLNFSSRMSTECLSYSQYDSESEETDVWIRRDDKLRCSDMSTKSKKKGFRGSSGFLPIKNVVSKVFGSKKSDKDKQSSRSFSVSEDVLRKANESTTKPSKKEAKLNKSELKATKAELKAESKQLKEAQKAEAKLLKAEAKRTKSELKASKKEAKMNKSINKSKQSEKLKDQCQNLNTSVDSLKKSAEDLIDIDKSDDEVFDTPLTVNTPNKSRSASVVDYSVDSKKSSTQIQNGDVGNTPDFSSETKGSSSVNQSNHKTEQNGKGNSKVTQSNGSVLNKSVSQSVSQHTTKTEMLLARRQRSLMNSSTEKTDTEEDSKKKCIVTTV